MSRRVLIAGTGIGGLSTALALHRRGIEVALFESAAEIAALGLLDELAAQGVRTAELCFFNRHGQLIWREPRGVDAGYEVPQVSVHRSELHRVLLGAVRARLGDDALVTGHAVQGFTSDEHDGRVRVELLDRQTDSIVHDEADL